MPSFVGQPLGSASRTLQDAGFKLGNVSVATPAAADSGGASGAIVEILPPPQPTPASIIVTQNPAAGQKVLAGALVSFEVR